MLSPEGIPQKSHIGWDGEYTKIIMQFGAAFLILVPFAFLFTDAITGFKETRAILKID